MNDGIGLFGNGLFGNLKVKNDEDSGGILNNKEVEKVESSNQGLFKGLFGDN